MSIYIVIQIDCCDSIRLIFYALRPCVFSKTTFAKIVSNKRYTEISWVRRTRCPSAVSNGLCVVRLGNSDRTDSGKTLGRLSIFRTANATTCANLKLQSRKNVSTADIIIYTDYHYTSHYI